MLKITFPKGEPETLIYGDYKMISLETFSSELISKLYSQENNETKHLIKRLLTP